MSDQDVRALARRIHDMEEKLAALSRSRQLTSSSVPITVDGDDGPEVIDVPLATGVSQGVQAGADSKYAKELAEQLEAELGPLPGQVQEALDEAADALAAAGLARSEAAQAVADASAAAGQAAQAVQDALAATELAEGAAPSWGTVDPVAADGAGKPVGAIWYVRDGAGRVLRMWELTALGWLNRPFDETAIPRLAIGPGTYGTLAGDRLVARSVTAAQIQALAISANELAANAVTAVKIAANAVTAAKIDAGAVTTDKLFALAVTADKIAVGAIIADKIAAGAITTTKLAATAIDGMVITGARIRTSPTGQRMEFDAAGLVSYNQAGTLTSRISASSGGMELTGQLKTRYTGDPRSTLVDPASITLYSNGDVLAENRRTFVRTGSLEFHYGDMTGPRHYRTLLDFLGLDFQYRPAQGRPWIHAGISVAGSNSRQHSEMFADQAIFERVEVAVLHPHRSGTHIKFEGPVSFQGDTDGLLTLPGGPAPGFTITADGCQYQIKNGEITVYIQLNGAVTGTATIWTGIPTELRPPRNSQGPAWMQGKPGTAFVRPDGSIGIVRSEDGGLGIQASVKYPKP